MLFNGFVLDDTQQIVDNVYVHSIVNIFSFFTGSTFYNGGATSLTGVYYKPLLTTFFSLIYTFFGATPFAFHFFQLLLHIINTCFVFLLFKRFFKNSIAFFLSLVFLIHPINSETVFYIADAQDILFFFFGIIAFYLLTIIKSKKALVLVIVSLFFSLLSKETGIVFIVTSIIYSYLFKPKYFKFMLLSSVCLFVCYVLLRLNAIGMLSKAASAPIDRLSLSERLINIPPMFLFYIKQFIYPLYLSSSYQWVYIQIGFANFFLPLCIDLLVIALLIAIAFILYKKRMHTYFKLYTFFLGWFFVGICLHLQLFPLDATVAERWFYFPIVGVLGMLGVVLSVATSKVHKAFAITLMVILILIFSARTFARSFDWRDEFTLVSHDSTVSHNNYYLENMVSINLTRQERFKEAKIYAEKSISDFPFYTNINTLGTIYTNEKNYKKAKETYLQALKYGDFYMTYENLGGLTLVSGNPKDNSALLTNILKKYPNDDKLWLYLAIEAYRQKDIDDAKAAINNAYHLNPNYTNAFYQYKITNNQPIEVKITTIPGS
ncbi:MAG: glycosyltransferase family 39 protein [Candidatus Levyibacteriota bacterium]